MKTVKSLLFSMCLSITSLVFGQQQEANQLLSAYYGVKNALVADDGKTASAQAEELVKVLKNFPEKNLTAAQLKTWKENSSKIQFEAAHIQETTDVGHQRDHLNDLTENLYALLKELKMNEDAVYQQYCPMKKAYWLSSEKEIKNPYYGKKMLTCGSVKSTLD